MSCVYAQNPWQINQLYDAKTKSFYIPYEMWFSIPFQGNKEQPLPNINTKELKGPFTWYHPHLKKILNVYKKISAHNIELFTLYPRGIAKVYDQKSNTYFNNGLNFPAGYGWKSRTLTNITQEKWQDNKHTIQTLGLYIKKIEFKKDMLDNIEYSIYLNGVLENSYRYWAP
jgi:hypothetical protein